VQGGAQALTPGREKWKTQTLMNNRQNFIIVYLTLQLLVNPSGVVYTP